MTRKCKSSAALSGWVCEFLIVTLLLAGCGGSSNSPYGVGDLSKTQLPTVDANEPFPAMSSEMVDAFIVEIPDLGKHRDEVLAAERDAINGILTELRAKSRAGNASALTLSREIDVQSQTAEGSHPLKDPSEWHFSLIPAANAQGPSLAGLGGVQQYLIGHQIGFFMVDGEPSKSDRGTSKTVEMKDGGTVQAVVELSVNKDGSVSLDLTTKVSMPVFGLDANSKVKLTGNLCPDADGKLDLKIESGSNGRAGSAGSVIYDKSLNARIRASVNDDAEVAGMDVDLNQGTRSTAGGRQVYVETSQSGQGKTDKFSEVQFGDPRIDRVSSQAKSSDQALSEKGLTDALRLAQGVLQSAEHRWQSGGCVKIDAASPGSVKINSTTQIPVKVVHKFDGSDVPSKVKAELSGGESIDPKLIPKTSGTMAYVAPGETGKSATIKLTGNSRRGRATLDLTANTGGKSYRASGQSNAVSFVGEICDLGKSFTLDATFPGGKAQTTFSPGGSTSVSGGGGGCTMTGGGNYTVTENPDGTAILKWTTTDKLACPGFGNSRTTSFTLTLQPAPDLSCP